MRQEVMMMKEKWDLWKESLTEIMSVSKREFLLMTAACILGGAVFGLMFSPRKYVMIGSCNGNNNGETDRQEDKPAKE